MSFEMSISEFEDMKRYNCPKNIIESKKLVIQEKFPQEYADYEKKKYIETIEKSVINCINIISVRGIFPMGYGKICHLTIEQCSQYGETYKKKHFDECNNFMVSSLNNDLQDFQKKYPDEFQDFIRKEHMCSDKSEQVKAYFQGIISIIKKEYIKEVVNEPNAKPKKEKVKKVNVPTEPRSKKEKVKNETPKMVDSLKETKPKKKAVSSTIKKLVWNKNNGEEIGKAKCYCCKSTDITQVSFHCGHIIAESNGGKTIVSNLKPICQNCNSSMGTNDMNEFMKTLE